jgi:hypothetical protein
VLLQDPDVDSIFAVRQLTLMFGKIELPCSDARVARAIDGYLKCEQELADRVDSTPEELLRQFERAAVLLWFDAFSAVDKAVEEGNILPRHGPGSTADKLLGNKKWTLPEWTVRMEDAGLHYVDFALPNHRYWRSALEESDDSVRPIICDGEDEVVSRRQHENTDRVQFLEPGAERPVKVITVPKTLKSPRIIAVEPTCMQYMQQGISTALVREVEKEWPSTRFKQVGQPSFGFVGFESQEINRLLALEGSKNCELATLDLSEASDRVMNGHVELLFGKHPSLSRAVQATRSTKARVPGKDGDAVIVELVKFASMGSALCFPVEALVFTTIIFAAIADAQGTPLTRSMINSLRGSVRVYGDDIIVPVEYVQPVIRYLEAFGLKVNSDKSFWTGKFRESCGGDYYDGEWVTPVRVRRKFPRTLADIHEVVSLVELRNRFYWNGLWASARHLDAIIRPLLRGSFPIVESTASGLGRHSVLPYKAERMCGRLHRPLVKVWQMDGKPPVSPLDGVPALLKCLSKTSDEPFVDPRHLERQGRPVAVGIKHRWVAPY